MNSVHDCKLSDYACIYSKVGLYLTQVYSIFMGLFTATSICSLFYVMFVFVYNLSYFDLPLVLFAVNAN